MTDLIPMGALGTPTPTRATHGALTLAETPDLGLLSVATHPDAPVPQLAAVTLPGPGQWSKGAGAVALWTGPGQWLIETGGAAQAAQLHKTLGEMPALRLTDQSDGWVCVEITSATGPAPIRALLEKCVNLAPDQIAPGRAARTLLHHLNCLLIRRADDRLAVLTARSSAGSLWHVLQEAAERQAVAERAAI